jgi:hypothetical protein
VKNRPPSNTLARRNESTKLRFFFSRTNRLLGRHEQMKRFPFRWLSPVCPYAAGRTAWQRRSEGSIIRRSGSIRKRPSQSSPLNWIPGTLLLHL